MLKESYNGYEQGPIRPPSEANSLLVRITRNCPWNRCTFCPVYKGETFSLRLVEHIIKDIDLVRFYVEQMRAAEKRGGHLSRRELCALSPHGERADLRAVTAAYSFFLSGMESIFLQDGNSLIIKPDNIIRVLRHLKTSFPEVRRITSYARSHTLARISDDHLRAMSASGLNRIHIGMESGSDQVLKKVKKGVDKATQIRAGQKVKKAGIELSEYVMPGLGGSALSRENAIETADALNQINPDFIRLRTLAMPAGAPLTEEFRNGRFDKMGEVETVRELAVFLEHLEGISSVIRSDHILNLFTEIDGQLPDDRPKMLAFLHQFLDLDPYEQMLFCIGRRTQRIARLADLQHPVLRSEIEDICRQLGATVDTMDQIIDKIMQRFI